MRNGFYRHPRSKAAVSRALRLSLGLLAGLTATTTCARAADWPTRPTTVIVPFAPGGNTDTMARLLAKGLSERLGQAFVVDDRAGASGAIGTSFVARANPDGYTLLFAAVQQVSVIPYTETVNYDPQKDLTPISIFGEGPFVLAVNTEIPPTSMKELIDYAKARPGQLSYGSGGVGSLTHLAPALFFEKAGVEITHVPYRGGGPAVADFLAGHVQVYFGNASELLPFTKDPHIRIIGVSTAKRMPQLPDTPTVAEIFPDFKMTSWNGLIGPANLPPNVVAGLSKAAIETAHDPAVVKALTNLGIAPVGSTQEEYRTTIANERPLLAEGIKAAGLEKK